MTDVTDRCTPAHTGASAFTFRRPVSRDYRDNVPASEWSAYSQVYTFDIPATGVLNSQSFESLCSLDNAARMAKNFDRVAYYVELKRPGTELQWVWVSMDAFTDDVCNIGVPTFAKGRTFQQKVANMNVFCNVPGLTTGTGLATGSIEFWPYDYYTGSVAANALGGDTSTYDFDDTAGTAGSYGSMQVHNWGAKQTIFAYNRWNASTANACLGIGNFTAVAAQPDWTGTENASAYSVRRMQIFVRYPADTAAPTIASAEALAAGTQIAVRFSETVSADSVARATFTSAAFTVKNAKLLADGVTVLLTTTAFDPDAENLTLAVAGIRDLAGNAIAEDATAALTRYTLPAEVIADVGSAADGYELVYAIDIPATGNFTGTRDAYLVDQSDREGAFDRVAYYVELRKPQEAHRWIWTACDAFARHRKMLDVPVPRTGITYQRPVYNTIILSNVGLGGHYPTGCNIEFWSCSYSGGCGGIVPNAPSGVYGWDDTIGGNTPLANGYGSMQFHCYQASVPLWGICNFGTDGNVLGMGYGSSKNLITGHLNELDWTFSQNASQFETRRMYVFVRPAAADRPTSEQVEQEVRNQVGETAFGAFKTLFAITDVPVACRVNDLAWRQANRFYALDRRCEFATNKITRVGYYLQLQKAGADPVWVWTAFDNFATDARHLGVPEGGYSYQVDIANLDVRSNSSAVTEVTGASGGCVEFWSANYGKGSDNKYDWSDVPDGTGTGVGYGSMQVHNKSASQVLWAFNNFNNGAKPGLGIGTNPSGEPDWTFQTNADGYSVRKLYCFVIPATGDRADVALNVRDHVAAKVGEAALQDFEVLFAANDIPVSCWGNKWEWMTLNFYTVDHRAEYASGGFDRVAYFMELQATGASESTWVWTAMDPFTTDGLRHGVPYGGYYFKKDIANLDVRSNSSAITEVTGASGGCVEFWASNYGEGSDGKYNWDDANYTTGSNGYGSMQVHNKAASQVLWAFNAFNGGGKPCLGIGNNPGSHPDWTFQQNADGYSVRRLVCFVRPCAAPADTVPAKANAIERAIASTDGNKITVRFANALTTRALADAVFTLDAGVKVKKVTLADATHVVLQTTDFAPGASLELALTGLKDANGTALADQVVTVDVPTAAQAALPADIASSVPALADYRLVQRLEIPKYPSAVYRNTPYCVDESYYGGRFDRVAYILDETPEGAAREWVCVSMDAFTANLTQIGLPVYERGAMFQQTVDHLDVAASAGVQVTTGMDLATGCIEFWPQGYLEPVTLANVGGLSAVYDWNDQPGTFGLGHGSMQVHNWEKGETLLSISRFGSNVSNREIDSGIGPCPNIGTKNAYGELISPDWTFATRAYTARTLYVLVREVTTPVSDGKGPAIVQQPQNARCVQHGSAELSVFAPSAAGFQWYRNGVAIAGATEAMICIDDARGSDDGAYTVAAFGADGSCTLSESARLTVIQPGTLLLVR